MSVWAVPWESVPGPCPTGLCPGLCPGSVSLLGSVLAPCPSWALSWVHVPPRLCPGSVSLLSSVPGLYPGSLSLLGSVPDPRPSWGLFQGSIPGPCPSRALSRGSPALPIPQSRGGAGLWQSCPAVGKRQNTLFSLCCRAQGNVLVAHLNFWEGQSTHLGKSCGSGVGEDCWKNSDFLNGKPGKIFN